MVFFCHLRIANTRSPATLLITEQPFPRAIVKGQVITLEAQLLLPSHIDLRFYLILYSFNTTSSVGHVKADMSHCVMPTKKGGKTAGPLVENASEPLDPEGKVLFSFMSIF